ncbi:MAG: LuxR C-terminal-related transcriptional regulator [Limisphaerales bacterium]
MAAVELARELKPDVLVTDLMIPRLHGLEVIKQVHRELKKTNILVLSTHSDEPLVKEALHNGATGYLLKECSSNDFMEALRTVAQGRRYMSPALADRIVENAIRGKDGDDTDIYDTLTSRERLVLRLAAEGNSTPQIAKKLFISPRTAETHRANLMRKLAFNSQTDLVRFAIRKGIISP